MKIIQPDENGVSRELNVLVLNLNREYFKQISDGEKTEEYRLDTPRWLTILSKPYDLIYIRSAYPSLAEINEKGYKVQLIFPYRGWEMKTITHEHFGNQPVRVFAIPLIN